MFRIEGTTVVMEAIFPQNFLSTTSQVVITNNHAI
jgi:hypothetical protein